MGLGPRGVSRGHRACGIVCSSRAKLETLRVFLVHQRTALFPYTNMPNDAVAFLVGTRTSSIRKADTTS